MISALDAETLALGTATLALGTATLALGAATSALGAATSALTWSFQRHWRGVSGDCGVGITPQMCNRVTYHADMSTFSKQAMAETVFTFKFELPALINLF